MINRNFELEEQDWKDFGYILIMKYKIKSRGRKLREFILAFNKENKHILEKRL